MCQWVGSAQQLLLFVHTEAGNYKYTYFGECAVLGARRAGSDCPTAGGIRVLSSGVRWEAEGALLVLYEWKFRRTNVSMRSTNGKK